MKSTSVRQEKMLRQVMKDDGESLSESQNPYLGGKSNKTHIRLFTSKKLNPTKNPLHCSGLRSLSDPVRIQT